jgi:hypothetical protein
MKVTVIKCDRCGKDISDSHYKNRIRFTIRYWHGGSIGGSEDEDEHEFDLCGDCAMEYGELTKNFIEQKD